MFYQGVRIYILEPNIELPSFVGGLDHYFRARSCSSPFEGIWFAHNKMCIADHKIVHVYQHFSVSIP